MKASLILTLALATLMFSCKENATKEVTITTSTTTPSPAALAEEEAKIAALLDSLNSAAARSDFDTYFSYYAEESIFAGTDATERWDKKQFMAWSKPQFDKRQTWHFSALDRHIYFDKTGQMAWFDELLNTEMKICRGSGVVTKENGNWKISQYILSMMMPNSQIGPALNLKAPEEDRMIDSLKR